MATKRNGKGSGTPGPTRRCWRQGDVLVVEKLPGDPGSAVEATKRDSGRVILAYGEVTGHAHALTGPGTQLQWDPSLAIPPGFDAAPDGILTLTEADTLRHEEHSAHTFEAGEYYVVRQKEYVPGAVPRNVLD